MLFFPKSNTVSRCPAYFWDFKEFYMSVQCENLCFAYMFYLYRKSDMHKIVVLLVVPEMELSFLECLLIEINYLQWRNFILFYFFIKYILLIMLQNGPVEGGWYTFTDWISPFFQGPPVLGLPCLLPGNYSFQCQRLVKRKGIIYSKVIQT